MATTVWLAARTFHAPSAGGHVWVYLNWALGLRALGCEVVWLELTAPNVAPDKLRSRVDILRRRLAPYGLADRIAVCGTSGSLPIPDEMGLIDPEAADGADLLLNLAYGVSPVLLQRFRRTALVDIDPGLFQIWIASGNFAVGRHDTYFTIGETVGQPDACFPDCDIEWHYTPPCVALEWWPVHETCATETFTTVSSWRMNQWIEHAGEVFKNDKRTGFLPFVGLPRHTKQPLELILHLTTSDARDRARLVKLGWHIRDSQAVAGTPWDYQDRVQEASGEFSCAKPSCVRLQNAWISDRTICFLASGKPAVVQHTGPSRFLPETEGLFRFRDIAAAVTSLEKIACDYAKHSATARKLAEEYFDAGKVVEGVLSRALA
jgi:hypothetical protein